MPASLGTYITVQPELIPTPPASNAGTMAGRLIQMDLCKTFASLTKVTPLSHVVMLHLFRYMQLVICCLYSFQLKSLENHGHEWFPCQVLSVPRAFLFLASTRISRLPEFHYSHLIELIDDGAIYYTRDPYSFDFLIENLMDIAHILIAHHALLGNDHFLFYIALTFLSTLSVSVNTCFSRMKGNRKNGSPIDMKVTANNFTHYECKFEERAGKKRKGVLTFERPAYSHVRRTDNLNIPQMHFFATPIEEGSSRVIMRIFGMKYVSKSLMHLAMHLTINPVTSGDIWLHNTERSVRIVKEQDTTRGSLVVGAARSGRKTIYGLNYIFASHADVGTISFRKWWSTYGLSSAPSNTFGPASASSLPKHALSSAEQNDPWCRHAERCIICRRALNRMRGLQKISIASTAISLITFHKQPLLAIACIVIGIQVHDLLRKLATTIEGNANRAEIPNRGYSATH